MELLGGVPGTGKSHLHIGLGTAAAQAGFRVRYTQLVNELVEAADERQLEQDHRPLRARRPVVCGRAEPRWEHERFRLGGPINRPKSSTWEEGFDLTAADDRYADINPYAPVGRGR